jgi:tetratricopeptide (TPR) repeat protein
VRVRATATLIAALMMVSPGAQAQSSPPPQQQQMAQPTAAQVLAQDQDDLAFVFVAKAYRSLAAKPKPGDAARDFAQQANQAAEQGRLADAAKLYAQALTGAPWWPQANYNAAMILAQLGVFHMAISDMSRYLALVPDAPNAHQAQDLIATWKREDVTPPTDPIGALVRLTAQGRVRLGVMVHDVPAIVAEARHLPSTQGALVVYVAKGSAAELAGLQAEDVVVTFAGNPVTAAADLPKAIGALPANATVPLDLIRGDQKMTVAVHFEN